MKDSVANAMKLFGKTIYRSLVAILLGSSFGLFAYAYWLVDVLPSKSTRLFIFGLIISISAIVGYFLLLRWFQFQLTKLTYPQRWLIVGLSLLTGLFLFFGSTTQWQKPRYIELFLPTHTVEIVIPADEAPRTLSITWLHTSLGDVPANTIDYQGWSKGEDQFILEAPSDNLFYWSGKTGEQVEVVFQARGNGSAIISCDGLAETFSITTRLARYDCNLSVPWYASRGAVLFLGILNFAALALALLLLIQLHQSELRTRWKDSVSAAPIWGKKDVLFLLAAFAIALLLRVPNLETPDPAVDEYYHLIAARQINEGVPTNEVYQRGFWLVTLPVSISLRVFGNEVWAARLVGALFNVLALLPLYLLTRRISRPIAILSIGLYAISPWIITFARIVREYAYYPFYFYLIIYGMVSFLDAFPQRFALSRDWKVLLQPRIGVLGIALFLPIIFPLLDPNSTFKLIWIAYLIFGLFVLSKCNLKDKGNLAVLFLFALFPILVLESGRALNPAWLGFTFNPVALSYFFPNPAQQWYYNHLAIVAAIGIVLAIVFSWTVRRVNPVPLFLFSLNVAFLFGFLFLFQTERFIRTRHLLTTNLWFLIIFAISLYALWSFLVILGPKRESFKVTLAILVAVSVLNIPQSFAPTSANESMSLISQDDYYDMKPVHQFMQENAKPDDALLATSYNLYVSWRQEPRFGAIYTMPRNLDDLIPLIESYTSGWVVIDVARLDLMPISIRDFLSTKDFEYLGLFGDQHVWHWHKVGSASKILSAGAFRIGG